MPAVANEHQRPRLFAPDRSRRAVRPNEIVCACLLVCAAASAPGAQPIYADPFGVLLPAPTARVVNVGTPAEFMLAAVHSTEPLVTLITTSPAGTVVTGAAIPVYAESIDAAAGDFDNDGDVDLAIVQPGSWSVQVLWREGDTLVPGPRWQLASVPTAIASADFNRDGHDDIAATLSLTNQAVVLFGNDGLGFDVGTPFYAGPSPNGIASGNFNNDDRPDLAVTNEFANTVTVLHQTPAGTFFTAQALPSNRRPRGIAAGDLNADGLTDLAVSNTSGGGIVATFLSQPTGVMTPGPTLFGAIQPGIPTITDADFDGDADLAIPDMGSNMLRVHIQNAGVFTPIAIDLGTRARTITLIDLDGNLSPDIIAASSTSDDGAILASVQSFPGAQCPGDINGDRVVDFMDLRIVIDNLGKTVSGGIADGDFIPDGVITQADVDIVEANLGLECGAS